jgi:hypothetical protein
MHYVRNKHYIKLKRQLALETPTTRRATDSTTSPTTRLPDVWEELKEHQVHYSEFSVGFIHLV